MSSRSLYPITGGHLKDFQEAWIRVYEGTTPWMYNRRDTCLCGLSRPWLAMIIEDLMIMRSYKNKSPFLDTGLYSTVTDER